VSNSLQARTITSFIFFSTNCEPNDLSRFVVDLRKRHCHGTSSQCVSFSLIDAGSVLRPARVVFLFFSACELCEADVMSRMNSMQFSNAHTPRQCLFAKDMSHYSSRQEHRMFLHFCTRTTTHSVFPT